MQRPRQNDRDVLRLAFAGADSVARRDLFLSNAQVTRAEALARSPLASPLVTVYTGLRSDSTLGYAFIDTHTVRTLPETIMVVVSPRGRVQAVYVLAFHEPAEYAAPPRWLHQFDRWTLTGESNQRGDIAGITGATLTANSIAAAVRRTLAVFEAGVSPALALADSSSGATATTTPR